MAGEVCRAFETAGAKPPAELKAMFEKFKAEMAAQGKVVHLGGKGYFSDFSNPTILYQLLFLLFVTEDLREVVTNMTKTRQKQRQPRRR